ncbi:MAG: ATP-binding cassette domain-containing protein [Candidatus Aegiribacteria sp.]|nr:ATP-binding cassette domain-containing protein [Candidatus Aegiribacteria sp.]
MKTEAESKRMMLGRAVSLVWKSSRGLTIANLLLTLLQGLLPLIPLYLMKLLIDSVEEVISGGNTSSFGHIGLLIGIMGGVALLMAAAKALAGIVEQTQARIVTDYMQDILHEKSIGVDLAYYEDSRFYDTLHRAQSEAPFRPTSIVNGLIRTAQSCVSLLAMVGLLLSFHWIVAVVLLAAALPGVFVKLKFSRIFWKWQRKRTETERRAWYKHWLITSVGHAKELRLFGLGEYFRKRYRDLRTILREEMLGIARRKAAADLGTQAVATVLVYGSLAFIAWQAFGGLITIGGMVMYFQAFQKGLGYLRGLLGSLAGLYEGNLFLSNLFDFLDIEPSVIDPPEPEPFPASISRGIVFDHVSFGYPSGNSRALDDISLSVRQGEMLALVGENGSGKTTLVKLLCRLYDPVSGIISVDGIPIRDFGIADLRGNISVIFQDYARYHLTAGQNISLGDIQHTPDESAIREAAVTAGTDSLISNLPDGYNTVLGRWFKGGKELSTGEWQKIALARAFVRNAPIVILDEPTSALDAKAEQDVFIKFRELVKGKTAVVISHRFSTVRMADRIAVLHKGRIIEHGTHQELIDIDGMYREMYTIQASAYS